jgi:nucleoside-diphosphate-sugar epimerase
LSKYLISGIHGNLGSLLKNSLDEFEVFTPKLKSSTAQVFIHLASKQEGDYKTIIDANINYLDKAIQFCKNNKIKNFVFLSAVSIYSSEDLYTISKLLGEKILENSGLKVLTLRVPMILTRDNNNGILNRILTKLLHHEEVLLYNGNKKFNNFISVEDIYSFIENYTFKKQYETLNLASKKSSTLYEIVNFLKSEVGSKSKIVLSKEQHPFFNLSIKKAKRRYGYKPKSNRVNLRNWLKIRNIQR